MLGLELILVLGFAVLACSLAGRGFGIAPPVLMLAPAAQCLDSFRRCAPSACRRTRRLALLASKRATILGLRDEHRIDDAVLRQIQDRLDIE